MINAFSIHSRMKSFYAIYIMELIDKTFSFMEVNPGLLSLEHCAN